MARYTLHMRSDGLIELHLGGVKVDTNFRAARENHKVEELLKKCNEALCKHSSETEEAIMTRIRANVAKENLDRKERNEKEKARMIEEGYTFEGGVDGAGWVAPSKIENTPNWLHAFINSQPNKPS